MAVAVRAVGAIASGTGAITPGLPTGTVKGDLLVMVCESKSGQTVTCAGWTEAPNSPQEDTTDSTRLTILWRRAQGSDARTTNDPGDHIMGRIIGFSGVIGYGSPWNVTAGGTESTADTSGSIPGATTTVNGCMIIAACCDGTDTASNNTTGFSGWTNASLASITERIDNRRLDGDGGSIGAATGIMTTAGTYNATTVTFANSARKGLWSGALLPATAIENLKDNFDDNSLDTQKWVEWNTGDLGESSGTMTLLSTTAAAYKGGDSTGIFDLTGSYILAEFQHVLTGLTDAGTFMLLTLDASNTMAFYVYNGDLVAEKQIATAYTTIATTTYNSTTHKWLRIREASGTVYFDYSADGISWTNFTSAANPFAVTGLFVTIQIGTDSANAGTDTAVIDNFNYPKTQTSRTALGKARITNSTPRTVLGKSRIAKTVSQTIAGKSRVTKSVPQTLLGKAAILKTTTQTVLGKASITAGATTPQTIAGKARVTNSTPQTVAGKSRITASTPRTVTGKGRITKTTSQTATGKARIQKSVSQTITGKARMTVSTPRTVTGRGRVTASTPQTTIGKARVTAVSPQTVAGKARVTKVVSQTIQGTSRVTKSVPQTVTGKSRITKSASQTIPGKSRITATTPQTVLGKGAILKTTTRDIQGLGRIQKIVARTITGIARVTKSVGRTVQGLARVTASTARTALGRARITATTPSTITGKSRIQVVTAQTVAGKSRVTKPTAQTIAGKSRVTAPTTRTVQGKGAVLKTTPQTIPGKAKITVVSTYTVTGKARIQKIVARTILGIASVFAPGTTQDLTGQALIEKTQGQTISGRASIASNIIPPQPDVIMIGDELAFRIDAFNYLVLD
jgi:hypothetical protein